MMNILPRVHSPLISDVRQTGSGPNLLTNEMTYADLGADYYVHRDNPETRKNRLLRQLLELGYHAELSTAA
jgi:hypothetical protein